jgi:hypothetical protein
MSIPATLTKLETSQASTERIDSRRFKVAASTTIKKGDFVKLDSSGNLVQYIAIPTALNAITATGTLGLLGKAAEDITTDASGISTSTSGAAFAKDDCEVELASPMTTYALRIINITGAAANTAYVPVAANSTLTVASMEVGLNAYRIVRYATAGQLDWFYGVCELATNGEFNILGLVPSQTATTEYGFVRGRINAASRQGAF